jgi:hypothetical protein
MAGSRALMPCLSMFGVGAVGPAAGDVAGSEAAGRGRTRTPSPLVPEESDFVCV